MIIYACLSPQCYTKTEEIYFQNTSGVCPRCGNKLKRISGEEPDVYQRLSLIYKKNAISRNSGYILRENKLRFW